MKVRCINNELIFYGQLSVGEIYEVQGEDSLRYHLIDDLGRDIFFNKERFEVIKEENKMEKTFREVIADIKEREVWICEKFNRKIIKGDDGVIEIRKLNDETFDNISGLIFNDEKYKLQRQQYSFEEAFKAYEKGKEIESCLSGYKYKKIDNIDHHSITGNKWGKEESFEIDEIRDKWYINN